MITLSRRNLLLLLYKVQTFGYGFIRKPDGSCVRAESDIVHYAGREPDLSGDPACEKFIVEMEQYLDSNEWLNERRVAMQAFADWYEAVHAKDDT